MPREEIIVGLDIGTSKIAAIIGDLRAGPDQIEIIGVGTTESSGLRKGVVVDIEKTAADIKKAVEIAELMAGVEIGSVYTGIAGGHITGITSRGVVAVAGDNHEITSSDVERAINAAQAVAIPVEREVLHVIPQEYMVDDQDGIKKPIGMSGVRLEASVHIVTGAVTSAQNIVKSVNSAGLAVEDIVLEPLASSEAVLTNDEKDMGAVLIDMGGGTTDIVICRNDALWHTSVLSLGGWHITNDISMGLRMPPAEAETIKRRYGSAMVDLVDKDETISIPTVGGRRPRVITRRMLAEIIQPRITEMLQLAAREIEKSDEMVPGGVVLTGGTSLLEGVLDLAEQIFDMPVRIGYPRELKGLADKVKSPIYATGVGLILFGSRERKTGSGGTRFMKGNLFEQILRRMRDWFIDYF